MLRLAILFTLLFPGMARLSLRGADEAQEPVAVQSFELYSALSGESAGIFTEQQLWRFVNDNFNLGFRIDVIGQDGQPMSVPYNWVWADEDDELLPPQKATFVKMALPPMPPRGVKLLDGANNDSPLTGDGSPANSPVITETSGLAGFVRKRFGSSAYLEVNGANYRIPYRWETVGADRVPFIEARVVVPVSQLVEFSKKTPRPDPLIHRPAIHDQLMEASHNGREPITFKELGDCLDREVREEPGRIGRYGGRGRLQARSYWNTAWMWQETMVNLEHIPEFESP